MITAVLFACSLFASGPVDVYAPEGTCIAVAQPAAPSLPAGCEGVATASRVGLEEWEESVWTCAEPVEGTYVVADADAVSESWLPVMLSYDGWNWRRFSPEPTPEALARSVWHLTTSDATVQVFRVLDTAVLSPVAGDGFRVDADCLVTSTVAPNYLNPKMAATCWKQASGNMAACAWASSGTAGVGSPFYGVKVGVTYAYPGGWLGAPALFVQGAAGVALNWVCETTIRTTRAP